MSTTRRSLVFTCVIAIAVVCAQFAAARWFAVWDAGAHVLAALPGGARDVVVIVCVFLLRLIAYFVIPPWVAWRVVSASLAHRVAAEGARPRGDRPT